ncbi:TlpA family protein disulfide reductase [Seongchinamella sediminis]|uniref:TlpA family protein disulfide reductase n=1 Tax=Seongchinamella sediminis TaxID=2283635 RepID=A0A3L7DZ84_9GAMM|nr:TlpA disulfide reductase family protein [Seongchinamella sediminis]RLQ21979.1 TlpA family protein disulfide reductase [Seongchinamella sediminis]
MKFVVAAITALLLTACTAPEPPLPDNLLPSLDRERYQGQWVVINYWAKWCKPCIKEIPELNALDRKYEQVAVLGVNFDAVRGDELQAQISQLGIEFPILLEEPSSALGTPMPQVLPTTLILDPDGKLVATLVGPQDLASLALATGQVGMPDSGPTAEDILPAETDERSP